MFAYYPAVAATGLAAAVLWHRPGAERVESRPQSIPIVDAARYGSDPCASCHRREANEWRTSQHRDAIADANDETLLGRFDGSTFSYAGTTSTFLKRDGAFYLRTDGRDGRLADFRVKYTFGLYPKQQYLVEFPDGRLQVPSIAWDARPRSEGGQNYDRAADRFETRWSEISVGCEACHGPGSRHVEWAGTLGSGKLASKDETKA